MLAHGCDVGMYTVVVHDMCLAERRCTVSSVWMLEAVCVGPR